MRDESNLGRWLKRLGGQPDGGDNPPFPQPLELAVAARESRVPRRVALKPGQAFSHYRIQKEVGRGAMAAVYQAVDDRDGRVVALKVLSLGEDWPEDRLEEARLRLFREAEAAGRIQHPDIVRVYEAGDDQGLVFLAMEFVEGTSLGNHAEPGRLLPPRMVTEMCARVADALHFAHQRGIVHRDIKPANIVFDQKQRRVRIMDFGVARFEESHATRTGIILGSPSYMPPEQLDGRKVTGSSDLFSLGVTWFQLLTGMLPFRSDSITGLMQKIANDPAPPLRTVRPDLPDCVQKTLDRALEKDPSRRFTNGAEMAIALRECVRQIPPGLL